MAVSILIPTPLRRFVGGTDTVSVEAKNVHEAIAALTMKHPDLKKQLLDDKGEIRSFVNIFVGEKSARDISNNYRDIPLQDGDVVMLVPAIAGG